VNLVVNRDLDAGAVDDRCHRGGGAGEDARDVPAVANPFHAVGKERCIRSTEVGCPEWRRVENWEPVSPSIKGEYYTLALVPCWQADVDTSLLKGNPAGVRRLHEVPAAKSRRVATGRASDRALARGSPTGTDAG